MTKPFTKNKKRAALIAGCSLLICLLIVTMIMRGRTSHSPGVSGNGADKTVTEPAAITITKETLETAGIEVMKVGREPAVTPLIATAATELNADRTSKISSRVTGRIIRLMASQGDRVSAGRPLALIDTVELDQIWSDYRKSKGRCDLAQKNLKREEILFEKKVAPEKDVLKARQELSEAEADLTFSKERFRLLGIDVATMETQRNGSDVRPFIPVVSSVGGVVIERPVTQGELVNPDKLLFTVADLSALWVLIDIYEKDMVRLKTGAVVNVSVSAFPNKLFQGKISYIGDVIDERTRTVKARVTIDNKEGFLKPGMFATVTIDLEKDGEAPKVIAIPEESILIEGTDRYVFVQVGKGMFKRKDIVCGRSLGTKVEVTKGLDEGDIVVAKGTFTLKAEYKKRTLKAE